MVVARKFTMKAMLTKTFRIWRLELMLNKMQRVAMVDADECKASKMEKLQDPISLLASHLLRRLLKVDADSKPLDLIWELLETETTLTMK